MSDRPRTVTSARVPPDQGGTRLLGERSPTPGVRLTLHASGIGEAILVRHRHSAHAGSGAEIAARVTHAGGVVSAVSWNDWHTKHQPVWQPSVEDWIATRIAADHAERT